MKEKYTKQEIIDIIEKIEMYYQWWDENANKDLYETVFELNSFHKCIEMTKDLFWITIDEDTL